MTYVPRNPSATKFWRWLFGETSLDDLGRTCACTRRIGPLFWVESDDRYAGRLAHALAVLEQAEMIRARWKKNFPGMEKFFDKMNPGYAIKYHSIQDEVIVEVGAPNTSPK